MFRAPFLAPSPCYWDEQCDPKKVCSVRLPNSPYCFALKEMDHIERSRLCEGPQLQLPVFPHLLLRRSQIATGLLYDLHMCACCKCVLLIKMTFADPKRKRKPTNPNKHKSNKRTKSTKISSLFPKRGNRNTKTTEKHKNKMTHGKTYNKSPRKINRKATKNKTNTGTTALERSVE